MEIPERLHHEDDPPVVEEVDEFEMLEVVDGTADERDAEVVEEVDEFSVPGLLLFVLGSGARSLFHRSG